MTDTAGRMAAVSLAKGCPFIDGGGVEVGVLAELG
jgi:hypothetical protein